MLARLKKASRRCAALIWALVLAFALAPAIGMANAEPVGSFSRFLVHAHDHDEQGHVHHGHDQLGGHHDHDDAAEEGPHGDSSQQRPHVHCDAGCPSVVIAALDVATLEFRVADAVAIAPVEPMEGTPPGRLLRPPIPSLLL